MALLGNHYRLGAGPAIHHLGSNTIGGMDRQQAYQPGRIRAGYVSEAKGAIAQVQAYPAGNGFDTAWLLNPKAGGMAWRPAGTGVFGLTGLAGRLMLAALSGAGDLSAERTEAILRTLLAEGSGTFTVAIEGRAPLSIDFDGTGDLDATITGLVELAAALSGSGDLDPELAGLVQAIVAWSGSSTFTADIAGLSLMLASFAGQGSITLDALGRFAMLVALSGTGDLDATAFGTAHAGVAWAGSGDMDELMTAFGDMSVDIVVTGTGLSTAGIADAVWAKLIESGLDAADVMRLLLAVAAGKTTIDGTTVAFRDQADTTDRVLAEMTGSERTTVTIDAS